MADFGELGSTDFGELSRAELAEVSRAVGDVFNNLVVDVFCEFYCALCPTGGADPAALTWFDKLTTGEKAIRSECLHPSQYTLAAPWARIPQFRYSARVLVTSSRKQPY